MSSGSRIRTPPLHPRQRPRPSARCSGRNSAHGDLSCLAAFGLTHRRPSRAPFLAAAAVLLLATSGAAPAVAAQAPKAHSPPPAPAPTGDAEPPLVSTSGMDESDHAQCVSELASKKVVFEQPKETTREGCRLSAPVSVSLVATQFGDVSLPAKPSMLCSFGLKFTDWVR